MRKTGGPPWARIVVAGWALAAPFGGQPSAWAASVGAPTDKDFNATGTSTSTTLTATLGPSGTERYMLVQVVFNSTAATVSSITHTGSTNLKRIVDATGNNGCRVETWGIVNPSTDSGHNNVLVTVSPATTFLISLSAWSGVDQLRPLRNSPAFATGTTSPASVTVYPSNTDGVIDTGCLTSQPALTLGANQVIIGDGANNGIKGMNSYKLITSTASTTMSRTFTGSATWMLGAVNLKASGATAVRLESLTVGAVGLVTRVGWRTGFEVDNLGFHIYRDDGSGRVRLTAAPIIGSALLAGSGVSLQAGRLYSWDDPIAPDQRGNARYWLEEIDLNGQRTMYGPATVSVPLPGNARPAVQPSSAALPTPTLAAPRATSYDLPPAPPAAPPPALDLGQESPKHWALSAGPALKIGVDHEGWYELARADLLAAGLDPSVDPRRLSLFVEGHEVPLVVRGEQDGRLDHADTVGFFGRGLESASTATRVYWLATGDRPGLRIEHAVPAPSSVAAPKSFAATVEGRPRSIYFAALANGDDSNFFGPIIGATATPISMRLRHRVPGAGPLALEVGTQGVSAGEHEIAVAIDGHSVGVLRSKGRERGNARFVLTDMLPVGDDIEVSLRAQGGDTDVSLVDFVRLEYPRQLVADGEGDQAALRFSAPGGTTVLVAGFSPGIDVDVLDVTDPLQPVQLPGAAADANGQRAIVTQGPGLRALVAFSRGHRETPHSLVANRPSHWTAPQPGSDLVVIGPASLLPAIEPLLQLRRAEGWNVALVDIEDVYDELSFGAKHPTAIRSFVHRAMRAWTSAPRAVVLLGDASLDPRDFLGKGAFDLVPTKLVDTELLETASDDWLTDFDGDGVADVPLGRIPARTPAEVAAIVAKLVKAPRFASVDAASAGGPLIFATDQNESSPISARPLATCAMPSPRRIEISSSIVVSTLEILSSACDRRFAWSHFS